MKRKEILLINDMPGVGKITITVMLPILSRLGYAVSTLPTALVSNTLDYGKFAILETTGYMRQAIDVWQALGFSFDAIAVGFVTSEEQTALVTDYCQRERERGVRVFVDPIMGDDGHLYNGIPETRVDEMRQLIQTADYIVPNLTEAMYLVDGACPSTAVDAATARRLVDALRERGAHSIVITSANVDGKDCVTGYDHEADAYFTFPYAAVSVRYPGTGDIFSSLFADHVLRGESVEESAQVAMDIVREMLLCCADGNDTFRGLPVEACMNLVR